MRILYLALAFACATPLAAQTETGTRLGGRPAQVPLTGSNAERSRVLLERFAACLAKREIKRTNTLIDAPVTLTDAAAFGILEVNYESCLSASGEADQLRMSGTLLRGALYADRVTRTVRRLTPDMIVGRTPDLGTGTARASLLQFGDCVMRAQPAASLAYVNSYATSEGETKALALLRPVMGGCLEAGADVKLSKSVIEAALAEVIYRTLKTPVSGGATS